MKYYAAIVLIAFAFASSLAQERDCADEFFSVQRRAGSCQDFFVCMVGGRVDFSCDPGHIFDERRIQCRNGDAETCEFINPEIPGDACDNEFNSIWPHPDPDRCGTFFVCMNYRMVVFNCDPLYIFDTTARRCIPGDRDTCEAFGPSPYENLMKKIGSFKQN